MKLKQSSLILLIVVLLISLTACSSSENSSTDLQTGSQLNISTNLSKMDEVNKESQEVGIQSVAQERFSNYTVAVTIEHQATAEVKTQNKSVNYGEKVSFSFNNLTPGNWEVQATLEADYTGGESYISQTGEDLNDVKIAESNKAAVEIKENETTTADNLTLALLEGEVALKVATAPDSNYVLNQIRLLDKNQQSLKTDSEITFGEQIAKWYSSLQSSAYSLEVDWALGDSNQQQERLLIPIPGLTKRIEVDFYEGQTEIGVGWDMPPTAPVNLEAQLQETSNGFSADINWTGVNNAANYIIERKVDTGVWEQLAEVESGTTEYSDQSIENNKVYQYSVLAVDSSGRTSDRSQPTDVISTSEKAVFEIANISITPNPVGQGEKLEVSAAVENRANDEIAQDISLKIDFGAGGVVERTENITLAASGTKTVVFNVDVPTNADVGVTTTVVSSNHDSSSQTFNLGLQQVTFVEESNVDGVTITITDSNDNQVAEVETGSHVSGIAVEYLESGDYSYTATVDTLEQTGSFSVADKDKRESLLMDFAGGAGTETEPYLISSWHHLDSLRDYGVQGGSNYSDDTYFKLSSDLDSSTPGYYQLVTSGQGWNPIGDSNSVFVGIVYGQENVISDLVIKRGSQNDIGLFACAGNKIQNLGLEDVDITGKDNVGGLVGTSYNSIVNNCYVTGAITGENRVGGLIAYMSGGEISNSHTNVSVEGGSSGANESNTAGGLVAYHESGKIIRSYVRGTVENDSENGEVGGLVGLNGSTGTIKKSYALSSVTSYGSSQVGGLVGFNNGVVKDSYAAGSVTDENGNADKIGGLIGSNNSVSDINNAYYDQETTGQSSSDGGTALSTAEMKQQATFDNWNFNDVWKIDEESSYPYLQWQDGENIPTP